MAEIIDLDFYRKFRVVLPVRPNTLDEQLIEDAPTLRVRKARKILPRTMIRTRRHTPKK